MGGEDGVERERIQGEGEDEGGEGHGVVAVV